MRDSRDEVDVELDAFKQQRGANDDDEADTSEDAAFLDNEKAQRDDIATSSLSWQEKRNVAMLFSLYLTHAVPLTFSWMTMPVLLRQHFGYALIATYYIAQYPYSVKVFWSPIVQSKYFHVLGRRRTWIVPSFLIGGILIFWLAFRQDAIMLQVSTTNSGTLFWLFAVWFVIMVLCATLRLALDDWSLDLFTPANVHVAGTILSLAETTGFFLSFNIFLGISSLGNPNVGTENESEPISTRFYFLATATVWVVVGVLVLLFQRDSTMEPSPARLDQSTTNPNTDTHHLTTPSTLQPTPRPPRRTLLQSYGIILRILKIPHVRTLMAIHMVGMTGFITNETVAMLELVKNQFTDRDIAAMATISTPLQLLTGVLVTWQFRRRHPWQVWRTLFPLRLANAFLVQLAVLIVSTPALQRGHHLLRWLVVIIPFLLAQQFTDLMFICLVAFHARVADRRYGGIYLPLLTTTLSMRYDLLGTVYTRVIGWIDGADDTAGNKDRKLINGYHIVNTVTVLAAIPIFVYYLVPSTKRLEKVPREAWLVRGVDGDEQEGENGGDDGRADGDIEVGARDSVDGDANIVRKGDYLAVSTRQDENDGDSDSGSSTNARRENSLLS